MKLLFVSVEASPFAKVGGLADVVGALPRTLRALGHDARVIMPLYRLIEDDPRWTLSTTLLEFDVAVGPGWTQRACLKSTTVDGQPIWFIGGDEAFTRATGSESVYQPGGRQYLFFCAAVLRAMEILGWMPDVVHCHDWHTGFLPVILREKAGRAWDKVGTLFTIHNLAYQGEFGTEILDMLGLPRSLYHPDRVEAWGRVNFLKAGMTYSDRVNTVSRTYAREIQTPEYGCGLDGLMRYLAERDRLSGILNGIDRKEFDPAHDPHLPVHFSVDDPSGKAACRTALLSEIGLTPIEGAPLIGMVSRLSSQKGMDLVLQAAEAMLDLPCQLVVLGLGEPELARGFRALAERCPSRFQFCERFDAPLGQRVYAGCDAFLMPSNFEPCGLGQMIAMRYGTVPVVRATGGLADTVQDNENGFVFYKKGPMELLAAVERMQATYANPEAWSRLVRNGMSADFGWERSAREYEALYTGCGEDRLALSA